MDTEKALYIISVAARIVGMHAQTLRKYERAGFLEPSRTDGHLRLYSRDDLRRLWQIKRLVEDRGINLGGVEMALTLADQLHQLAVIVEEVSDPTLLRATLRQSIAAMLRDLEVEE